MNQLEMLSIRIQGDACGSDVMLAVRLECCMLEMLSVRMYQYRPDVTQ